jgi:glucose 1-dehydrogenase/3-oxoacyl-[acyl-carrier protein] reductase
MDLGLHDKAALCTAATSGLGLSSAKALAREGCDVAVCGTTPAHVDEAREELRSVGDGEVIAVEADITDPDDVTAFVEATVERFGGLDHVVTSAGGPASGSFTETTEREWYQAYDLLVMSYVWTTRAALPHLRNDGGSITAITSRSVREVLDDLVLSNAVRRAVIGLVKTQSREFAPEVRVNAVLPGAHETSRIQELVEDAVERGDYDDYDQGLADWGSDVPLGRIGDPEELGDVVAFLASERASYVTGVGLPIDGGSMRS